MEVNSPESDVAAAKSILKRGAVEIHDKNQILGVVKQSLDVNFIAEYPKEEFTSDLLPCIRNLLSSVYNDNLSMNSTEYISEIEENLMICASLINIIKSVLEIEDIEKNPVEFSKFFLVTYKHCAKSQKKYKEGNSAKKIVEIFKKNHECYLEWIENLMNVNLNEHSDEVLKIFLEIVEILNNLNKKAFAESWRSFSGVIEQNDEFLDVEQCHFMEIIEVLTSHIKRLTNAALDSVDLEYKLTSQFVKLSAFLIKIGVRIIVKFWKFIHEEHKKIVHNFLCTLFSYSPELLKKFKLDSQLENMIIASSVDEFSQRLQELVITNEFLEDFPDFIEDKLGPGCLLIDIKLLESSANCSVDSTVLLKHIFEDISNYYSEFFYNTNEDELFAKLNSIISQSMVKSLNDSNYIEMEKILFENILGNNSWCSYLASQVWINNFRMSSSGSKLDTAYSFMETVKNLNIDISFESSKIVIISHLFTELFKSLSENDIKTILNNYPPIENMNVWRLIEFDKNNTQDCRNLLTSITDLVLEKSGKADCMEVTELIEFLEIFKLISTINHKSLERIEDLMISLEVLWKFNYENSKNHFFKLFIKKLCHISMGFMENLPDTLTIFIFEKMKLLSKSSVFFKLLLCDLLKQFARCRNVKHNAMQNKLSFFISDLFEMLLTGDEKIVNELGLEALKVFSDKNKHVIIVNNVCRMLPNLNLEKFIRDSNNTRTSHKEFAAAVGLLKPTFDKHKCINSQEKCSSNKTVLTNFRINSNCFVKSGISYGKKRRLDENDDKIEAAEDYTVDEVLKRIKSEIVCLKKVLKTEKVTPKNSRDIKVLVNQLQNVID